MTRHFMNTNLVKVHYFPENEHNETTINKISSTDDTTGKTRHKRTPTNIYGGPLHKNDKTLIKIKLQVITATTHPMHSVLSLATHRKIIGRRGVVAHTFHPSTWEAEAGGSL